MTNAMPTIIIPKGTPVSELAEGTLIKTTEAGAPVEFYLAKHDYESALNGDGRQLIVRKDCYDQRQWHTSNVNVYATSAIDSWLNNVYKLYFPESLQRLISTTNFVYTQKGGISTTTTLARGVFILSGTELGLSTGGMNVEGTALPIASLLKTVYLNGKLSDQWTRSCYASRGSVQTDQSAWYVNTSGALYDWGVSWEHGSRPCFTLPADAMVDDDLNIIV